MEEAPKISRFWHELYVEMVSNPMDSRTDKKFCEDVNISVSALEQWKTKNRSAIFNEVDRRRKNYLKEIRARAYKALMKRMDESDKGLEMTLKITGDMVERSEQVVETRTNEDKIRRVRSLLDSIGKKEASWARADGSTKPGHVPGELGGDESGAVPKSPNLEGKEPGMGDVKAG